MGQKVKGHSLTWGHGPHTPICEKMEEHVPPGKLAENGACRSDSSRILIIRVWQAPIPPHYFMIRGWRGKKARAGDREWESICPLTG